ncbi:GNAT family N-acetyltransferase [Vibrio campbellii]|uniref:GNAT family N-acetyltransferase n=1 Tax=Vibrio campbellii TaxID=680 RepID=A0ACC7R6L2_9VIBR|nr:GNAT family N-acetyltransferase [Vibrio campbellii]AYO11710.1 GNAT family N-acetyltransferase [Vibrio campbellii]NIY87584.1 GNAT family N-acetyltransferase [Vibrio campbellii]NVK68474.1 GNAT family N-acetyltransferase [Vibrio campbellii]HDM8229239.1 GNAT family N-acetyltransferase [Vibrio campbellii]
MKIKPELELTQEEHQAIMTLRNAAFPDHQSAHSYYKQLPHYRALEFQGSKLIGYMGLDYRVMNLNGEPIRVLGIIDLCVDTDFQGKGVASAMLNTVTEYAKDKDVDFIALMADDPSLYLKNGFQGLEVEASWLRIHEHKNYGIAEERLNDFYVKPLRDQTMIKSGLDWLGYMY